MSVAVVVFKGHPCTCKSTLALAIARDLGCALIAKDDARDALETCASGRALPSADANAMSLEVLWNALRSQLRAGIGCVVDTTLSRPDHLARVKAICDAERPRTHTLTLVECIVSDASVWEARLNARNEALGANERHKVFTWPALQTLIAGYGKSYEYSAHDLAGCTRIVIDTTNPRAALEHLRGRLARKIGSIPTCAPGETEGPVM